MLTAAMSATHLAISGNKRFRVWAAEDGFYTFF
jgi:hypothetical protein